MDITEVVTWFFSTIFSFCADCFNLLDSIIVFNGVTLLDFFLTVMIISFALPIILNLRKNRGSKSD